MKLIPAVDDRMNFVVFWADYVKTHSDKDWGLQQKKLVDSQMQGAKSFGLSAKEYLDLKGEKHGR